MRGKISRRAVELISLNLHFKGDLDKWEYENFNYIMALFDLYHRHGTLPYPGTLSEQPAKVIEIFQILDQLKYEREKKQHEEQERQAERSRKRKK